MPESHIKQKGHLEPELLILLKRPREPELLALPTRPHWRRCQDLLIKKKVKKLESCQKLEWENKHAPLHTLKLPAEYWLSRQTKKKQIKKWRALEVSQTLGQMTGRMRMSTSNLPRPIWHPQR